MVPCWIVRYALILALACLPACGGSPSSPSPTPSPSPQPTHISGTITDTMSGASVGSFTSDASSFPARVTVSLAGYLTRETWVRSASPTVDLIRDAAPFDLGFYRQLVRNGYESPGALTPVAVLKVSPSIYLQTVGLSAANIAALEQAARAVVPAMSGGVLNVAAWETGADVRAPANGWIVVELVNEPDGTSCGRANVGLAAGHIWLNTHARCRFGGTDTDPGSLAHELGHALGFWHVAPGSLMGASRQFGLKDPSAAERYHAAIAYHRSAGNTDVDVDNLSSAPAQTMRVVD